MIILLSPAKTQDFSPLLHKNNVTFSEPLFLDEAETFVSHLKKHSVQELITILDVSEKIATVNAERYQHFQTPFTEKNAKPALFAYDGDVYEPLEIETYGEEELRYANQHIRILTGLYGLLRPLDLMQAYRLEMKTKLPELSTTLADFWKQKITEELNQELAQDESGELVHLTSQEYFAAVDPDQIKGNIITPIFQEKKQGKYQTIGILAKKARGMMANFAIQKKLKTAAELKTFTAHGYHFQPERSNSQEWFFVRP